MRLLARRDLKDITKGGHLVASDGAVGLGRLGAECDDRDSECNTTVPIGDRSLAIPTPNPIPIPMAVRNVAGGAFEQRSDRTA
jgi:hypothetical protein